MRATQATSPPSTRATSGTRGSALLATGVIALTVGATVFIADRFQEILLALVVVALALGLRRAVGVARAWRADGSGTPGAAIAVSAPPWRLAAVVSVVLIGGELTLIAAAVLLQITTNENWFKLYVLGLISLPTTALIGPMLLVQQRWTPGHPHLEAEAATLSDERSGTRRAIIATRVLAVVSWALALLLALAVIGLLGVILHAH